MRLLVAMTLSWMCAPWALACEGSQDCDLSEHKAPEDARKASKDLRLMADHCSYSTATMIGRVLDKGEAWSFKGQLTQASDLAMDVAAPFLAGSEGPRVLANLVLDRVLAHRKDPADVVSVSGRMLVQGGVRYAVIVEVVPSGT